VHLHLWVGEAALPIAQLGPDFLILATPTDLAANEAEIVMRVDANERRWPVSLPEGLNATAQRTRIARR
jgi:hypothetical protein